MGLINFAVGVVVVRWFGPHADYDSLNIEEV
jgi:hypothetical protein